MAFLARNQDYMASNLKIEAKVVTFLCASLVSKDLLQPIIHD